MEKKRFILFTETFKNHRADRFKEECEKRGIGFIMINSYKTVLTNSDIFDQDGNKVVFKKGDVIWFLANLTIGHFIARKLKMEGKQIWPDVGAIDFADKFFTNMFFTTIGIPTPKTVLVNSYHFEKTVEKVGGYPCVIKKNVSTVGKFVEIVNNDEESKGFIKDAFDKAKKNVLPLNRLRFLFQELITEARGVDYRVLCLNGKIIGAIKREAQEGFKSNVSLGGTATQVEVDEKMAEYALRIMKEGNLFYAGIDFIKRGDEYLAIEVNTSAQFKGFEGATGINVAGKIIGALLDQ